MRKPLLIGEAPSREVGEPLGGRSGRFLAKQIGCSFEEYLAAFDRVNVFPEWPGSAGKGSKFPMKAAQVAASMMSFADRPCVFFLGERVAGAFGVAETGAFQLALTVGLGDWERTFPHVRRIFATRDGRPTHKNDSGRMPFWWVIPHPSGVNRVWNDPPIQRNVGLLLGAAMERNWG